jgi:hypothetical protein
MKKVSLTMVPNRLSSYNPVTVKSYPNGKLVYQPPPRSRQGWTIYVPQLRELNTRTIHRKSKKKFSVTAYVDDNYSSSLPALDRNRRGTQAYLPMSSEFGLPPSNECIGLLPCNASAISSCTSPRPIQWIGGGELDDLRLRIGDQFLRFNSEG